MPQLKHFYDIIKLTKWGQMERLNNNEQLSSENTKTEWDSLSEEEFKGYNKKAESVKNPEEEKNYEKASEILNHEATEYNTLLQPFQNLQAVDADTKVKLKRFGLDIDHQEKSPVVMLYELPEPSKDEILDFAKEREYDFNKLNSFVNGEHQKEVREALEKRGFKDTPQSWSDQNFTTHEIALMHQIAENAHK